LGKVNESQELEKKRKRKKVSQEIFSNIKLRNKKNIRVTDWEADEKVMLDETDVDSGLPYRNTIFPEHRLVEEQ
jgi:hypothetical protein